MKRLVFIAEARAELINSAERYEQQRRGLGDDFLEEVRILTTRLLQYPESAPLAVADVRRARVQRFPFDLLYRSRGDRIIIVAVMHHRRDPDYWKDRI